LSGIYAEGLCQFAPGGDYSCFQLPAVLPPCSTTMVVTAGAACSIPDCEPCGLDYYDSSGTLKNGYCVCDGTRSVWSCASTTAWPPQ
jgi:hypothetical protein